MKVSFEGSLEEFQLIFGEGTGAKRGYAPKQAGGPPFISATEKPGTFVPYVNEQEPEVRLPEMSFHPLAGAKANYWEDLPPLPKDDDPYAPRPTIVLPPIEPEIRKEAWAKFVEFCETWLDGYNDPSLPQPDRLAMMQDLGHGRFTIPILIMAYEIKSLQRLVQKALKEATGTLFDLGFVDKVACNMVQISHMGYPDLAGTYDYSTAWKRNAPKELQ